MAQPLLHACSMTLAVVVVALLAAETNVTPKESCEALRANARFSPYFERVELDKLVQTVADATCRTFVMGESVKGKISVIGPENGHGALDADQFYAVFLSALDANGFAVVPSGRYLRIVEKPRAKSGPIPLLEPGAKFPARDELVTRVFHLQHAELEPARNVIGQFLSQGADVVPFAPDTLIVDELGSNLERLERLVAAIDVERASNEELRVLTVRYAEASQLAEEVTRILAPKQPKPTEVLSLTADERSNRIVMVSTAALGKRAAELIAQLDVALPGDGKAHVYKLANAEAKDLAANLTEVISASRGPKPANAATGGALEPKISANESLNALVIVASNADYRNLVELISQLDAPRRQVLIETVVMEVNLERNNALGASGHLFAGDSDLRVGVGSQPGGAPDSLNPASAFAGAGMLFGLQGPEVKALSKVLGFTVGQYGLALTATQDTSDMNVLSTPHILTTDNKEAEISVGQKIPFNNGIASQLVATQLAANPGAAAGAAAAGLGSITRQNIELKLIVKPHIGEGDNVRLEINQSAEEIAGEDPKGLGPITSTRTQKTMVVAQDSETIVLGGIMQDRVIETVSKTPVLGDLPVLGHFFRFEKKKKVKVNLLVFLTPHIIREPADFQRLMDAKIAERKRVLEDEYGTDPTRYPIDYSRKVGPLMAMARAVRREELRPENGGPGAPDERVIAPASAPPHERGSQPSAPAP